jgi:hypothetical protein
MQGEYGKSPSHASVSMSAQLQCQTAITSPSFSNTSSSELKPPYILLTTRANKPEVDRVAAPMQIALL